MDLHGDTEHVIVAMKSNLNDTSNLTHPTHTHARNSTRLRILRIFTKKKASINILLGPQAKMSVMLVVRLFHSLPISAASL